MSRMSCVLTLATLLAIGSSTPSAAASHAKQHTAKRTHAQAVTQTATAVPHMNGVSCPVSDPSKCPASCRPSGAAATTAVAANARH